MSAVYLLTLAGIRETPIRPSAAQISPEYLDFQHTWTCLTPTVLVLEAIFAAVTDHVSVQAMAKLHAVGYREDDVYLHCAPLFHVGGLSSMIAMLAAGATQARRQLPHHLQLPVKVYAMPPEVLKLNDVPTHTAEGQHMRVS